MQPKDPRDECNFKHRHACIVVVEMKSHVRDDYGAGMKANLQAATVIIVIVSFFIFDKDRCTGHLGAELSVLVEEIVFKCKAPAPRK